MRDEADRFGDLGARVVLIGLGRPEQAADFCGRRRLAFDCVVQPERTAHKAFGLRRGTWNETTGPAVWVPWMKNVAAGRLQGGFGQGDPAQMGGTFVVDTEGIVRYAFRARRSSEIAGTDEVLEAVAAVVGGRG